MIFCESLGLSLVEWFERNKRPMAWRDDPTPYHVWISEIMLQQTRVDTVRGYYDRFMKVFPTVRDLSEAEEEVLLKQWEGLGYYTRARNLQKAAKRVVSEFGGELPASYEELRKLPGIGSYTAGAILSIAFHKRYPVVDGNVLRVLSRLLGRTEDIRDPGTKAGFEKELKEYLDRTEADPGVFNQGLMELGALVCVPNGAPKCGLCPWKDACKTRESGRWQEIPVLRPKEKKRTERKTVILCYSGDRILMEKRGRNVLLAHLFGFPAAEGFLSETGVRNLFPDVSGLVVRALPEKKHVFTHRIWEMKAYEVRLPGDPEIPEEIRKLTSGSLQWASGQDLKDRIALPAAYRKWAVQIGIEES